MDYDNRHKQYERDISGLQRCIKRADTRINWRSSSRTRSTSRNRSRSPVGSKSRNRTRSRTRSRGRLQEYRKDDKSSSYKNETRVRDTVMVTSDHGHEPKTPEFQNVSPNHTILIKGLVQDIDDKDILKDVIYTCGLMPKDLRLIRNKRTGVSRGFAFVEFGTVAEATQYMEMKQGELILKHQCRASMCYTIENVKKMDWFCFECATRNFSKRIYCYKCQASRILSEMEGYGYDEICTYVTKTIMLTNLDTLTTESSVLQILACRISETIIKTISEVSIKRDPVTSVSCGICYLGTDNTTDASTLRETLTNLSPPLDIDGKRVIISYCKYNIGNMKNTLEQASNVTFSPTKRLNKYSLNDADRLAEYSASKGAQIAENHEPYLEYYKNYDTQHILDCKNTEKTVSGTFPLSQSEIEQGQTSKTFPVTTLGLPNGNDGKRYPVPDITNYKWKDNNGYFYDYDTGLYYDPNSTYHYNSIIRKYLYYDTEKQTYVLAPPVLEPNNAEIKNPITIENTLKTKIARIKKRRHLTKERQIIKDMEKWTTSLNQGKASALRTNSNDIATNLSKSKLITDIRHSEPLKENHFPIATSNCATKITTSAPLVAQSSPLLKFLREMEQLSESHTNEMVFLDFSQSICNLCHRQLPSPDVLVQHAQLSKLHKDNLQKYNAKKTQPLFDINTK